MLAKELKQQLVESFRTHSRHDRFRNYLGMSGIGGCPRQLYFQTIEPIEADDRLKWYGWTGYLHEAGLKDLLGAHEEAVATLLGGSSPVGRELIADFDERYRGHTDYELSDGTLVEIKSTRWDKWIEIKAIKGANPRHIAQVQAYMRHGDYPHAILIYVARDMPHRDWEFPFWCVDVPRDEWLMNELDEKAKMILAAIDSGRPPDCTCKYCRR
jgi:hypothetical protein